MWLLVVITAHLFNAGAFLVDKYLLKKSIPQPAIYSFFIGLLGAVSLVLMPWGWFVPGFWQAILMIVSGFTFVGALYFFFAALKIGDASKVVPLTGGLQPLIILLLSFSFLGERLSYFQIIAFIFLLVGSIYISRENISSQQKLARKVFGIAMFSSVLFAISYVCAKEIYNTLPFLGSFIWMRLAAGIFALSFLLSSSFRKHLNAFRHGSRNKQQVKNSSLLFFSGQVSGALGFVLLNYAISLASASLVTAMQGVQYVFLLVIAVIFSTKYPSILKEQLNKEILAQKILAILLICLGLFILAFAN